jgi:hypothetical protein
MHFLALLDRETVQSDVHYLARLFSVSDVFDVRLGHSKDAKLSSVYFHKVYIPILY